MLDYATIVLLSLMVFSHLALQWHCFGFRKGIPALMDAANIGASAMDERANTLLETVDEGVQILADLADTMDAPAGGSGGPVNSPVASLLTNLLMTRTGLALEHGSSQERQIREEDPTHSSEEDN